MNSPVLLHAFAERAGVLPSAARGFRDADLADDIAFGNGKRRERLWDLSSYLHCSIIGTCLTTAELRQFFVKLKDPLAKTASDHEIHSLAVQGAARRDLPGKLLHKMLDKRHEAHIRRFGKTATVEDLRGLWRACLAKGEVPGAYWAVLTHPLTDQALIREVFGDVHMLSHLVGMSNRMDIAKLRELERERAASAEKIARQEARLRQGAEERVALRRDVERLERDLRLAQDLRLVQDHQVVPASEPAASSNLRQRLADEQAHAAALGTRLATRDQELAASAERVRVLEQQVEELVREVRAMEAALAVSSADAPDSAALDLAGRCLLYVGGRPRQVEQVKAMAERLGGRLLCHDGGVEETTALLPGLISQVDMAVFPVDCVSHLASSQVKRLCREAGKPFVALRGSGLASFAAALAAFAAPLPHAAE